jgi:hypothetical protein
MGERRSLIHENSIPAPLSLYPPWIEILNDPREPEALSITPPKVWAIEPGMDEELSTTRPAGYVVAPWIFQKDLMSCRLDRSGANQRLSRTPIFARVVMQREFRGAEHRQKLGLVVGVSLESVV